MGIIGSTPRSAHWVRSGEARSSNGHGCYSLVTKCLNPDPLDKWHGRRAQVKELSFRPLGSLLSLEFSSAVGKTLESGRSWVWTQPSLSQYRVTVGFGFTPPAIYASSTFLFTFSDRGLIRIFLRGFKGILIPGLPGVILLFQMNAQNSGAFWCLFCLFCSVYRPFQHK